MKIIFLFLLMSIISFTNAYVSNNICEWDYEDDDFEFEWAIAPIRPTSTDYDYLKRHIRVICFSGDPYPSEPPVRGPAIGFNGKVFNEFIFSHSKNDNSDVCDSWYSHHFKTNWDEDTCKLKGIPIS